MIDSEGWWSVIGVLQLEKGNSDPPARWNGFLATMAVIYHAIPSRGFSLSERPETVETRKPLRLRKQLPQGASGSVEEESVLLR